MNCPQRDFFGPWRSSLGHTATCGHNHCTVHPVVQYINPKPPKRDEVTKWHDSTDVILDYVQTYLKYGSATDDVQSSSLREMNDALLTDTRLTYDERLAEAQTYNYQAQYLSMKLQILLNRENGTDYRAWARRYAVLHEKGYGARTAAADEAALSDPYVVTIDPRTFVISRPSSFR